MENKIISNKAQCKKCKDIIESKDTNDLKRCTCGSIAVDGGLEYIKRIGNPDDVIELSEYEKENSNDNGHRFALPFFHAFLKESVAKNFLRSFASPLRPPGGGLEKYQVSARLIVFRRGGYHPPARGRLCRAGVCPRRIFGTPFS